MLFFWANFPIFLVWLTGLSMLETSLHTIAPPLEQAVLWLSIIPLVAALTLLGCALRKKKGLFVPGQYFPWAFALTAFYILSWVHRSSLPLSIETHRHIYEASAIIEFILIMIHARIRLKGWDWLWVFGVTLFFGMILENGGIAMGFFREEGYFMYIPGLRAPVATMLGWVNVLYCGFFAVEEVLPQMRPVLKGLVCAGVGLAMDIPFDPVATRLSWWVWNDELTMSIWGVPVINYVAWFWALFPYAWCYYAVRGREGSTQGRKVALFSALVPMILVVELIGAVMSLWALGDHGALEIVARFFRQFVP